ncbi:YfhO family protein [Butyrivibrio sp. FC2001]|uniref:YfhO family protein n=1 Tax=Butyrivibrio sp. FC2001 TaxID=1280671 RepID=UPI000406F5B3|nr:YfhO family protein [Butyrivibrio sp. FC2001]
MNGVKAKLENLFTNDWEKRYYSIYTLCFLILALCGFSWFFFTGRSLIWMVDGWDQHFKALVYYSEYLKEILHHLVREHHIVIPDWDFYIGEGADILGTLHYYIIGDPIALLSVLVPYEYMHIFYSASCIFRLYLSGMAFSELCFHNKSIGKKGILAASLAYSFCEFGLLNAARHPYFLNPMILFPIILLGIEKIISKEKPYLFIISIAIAAICNLYFFYMIVILTIVYVFIRLLFIYKKSIESLLVQLLKLGIYAVVGVCMAGMIFLPVLMMFMSDSRLSISQPFHWVYEPIHYSMLPGAIITYDAPNWACMGFALPVVLAVFILFFKKSDGILKVLFICSLLVLLFPLGGRILNGMQYATNRWIWAFALLCAYILAKEWDELLQLSNRRWGALFAGGIGFYVICIICGKSRNTAAFSAISLLFITLIGIHNDIIISKRYIKECFLLLMVMISIVNVAFWHFSPETANYVKEFKENRKIWDDWNYNDSVKVKSVSDDAYVRYSGNNLDINTNMVNKVSTTQYYWSNSNPYMNEYRQDLEMRESKYYKYVGYDDRTTPLTLSASKYFVVHNKEENIIPYGYDVVDKDEEYTVYKNKYDLPLGYFYDSYIPDYEWDTLNPVQKQETLLDAACVEEDFEDLNEYTNEMNDYIVPYSAGLEGEISFIDQGVLTTADDTRMVLTFEHEIDKEELYVGFEGLRFYGTPEYDLYFGNEEIDPNNLYDKTAWDKLDRNRQFEIKQEKKYWNSIVNVNVSIESDTGSKKKINYLQPEARFSSGRHDFITNLGYAEKTVTTVTITFPKRGRYMFDSLTVYTVPMADYKEKIERLKQDTLDNIQISTDTIYGKCNLDGKKLLCVATPYSKGWKGYIDGVEGEVLLVNAHYIGMLVDEGEHEILFYYRTPYKKEGILLSLLGIVMYICVIFFYKSKKHKIHEKLQ